MIAGLPVDAWILLTVAVGLGLGLELAFLRARRREARGSRHAGSKARRPDARESARERNGSGR